MAIRERGSPCKKYLLLPLPVVFLLSLPAAGKEGVLKSELCQGEPSVVAFYQKRGEGWDAYDDGDGCRKNQREKKPSGKKNTLPLEGEKKGNLLSDRELREGDPYQWAMTTDSSREYREAMVLLTDKAIYYPTEENIKNLLVASERSMTNSYKTAYVAQQVIAKYPELDQQNRMNSSIRGLSIRTKGEKEKVRSKLESLKGRAALLAFFDHLDPYSIAQAEFLSIVESRYGLTVFPVSTKGGMLFRYPRAKSDNGIGKRMKLPKTPSIYLVYPEEKEYVLVSTYLMAVDTLERRLYQLASIADGENPYEEDVPLIKIRRKLPPLSYRYPSRYLLWAEGIKSQNSILKYPVAPVEGRGSHG